MLRPLGIGEILDAGIKVVLRNWRTFLACTAALMASEDVKSRYLGV